MYRIFIITIIALFGFTACGSEVADNTNVNTTPAAVENTNAEDQNTTPGVANEEVPEFDDAELALKKGVEYLDDNKLANAINALKQAVDLDKDLAEAHFQLGVALSLTESEEEKIVPDQIVDDNEEKTAKKGKKESEIVFENAVKAYKKVVAKDGKNHVAYFNLGRAYSKLYDDKKARTALERAVKLNDEDTAYRTELGSVLIKLAQYASAIRQLNKALELDDTNYRAEDLLEKAKAGKKRVGHKKTPRPGPTPKSSESPVSPTKPTDGTAVPDSKTAASPPPAPPKPAPKKPVKPKKN
jgi:tetratricopeptide (TPR) repeat protein